MNIYLYIHGFEDEWKDISMSVCMYEWMGGRMGECLRACMLSWSAAVLIILLGAVKLSQFLAAI